MPPELLARVSELDSLDLIEALETAYLEKHGCPVINVSHWDSSPEFKATLRKYLDIPLVWPVEDYLFSYSDEVYDVAACLRSVFGFDENTGYLITPSGSTSIVCVVNWLAAMGIKQLTVCSPAYFSLFHICRRYGIEIAEKFMVRIPQGYELPELAESNRYKAGALWLTNPIYSTGVPIKTEDVGKIELLLENGWYVIADECLAVQGVELGRFLGHHSRFIGIYSPHKGICMNAVKFSAIIFNEQNQRFFDHWADILYGCISISTKAAMAHFLSPNFRTYESMFFKGIDLSKKFIESAIRNIPGASSDRHSIGGFITCYFPGLKSDLGNDPHFLRNVIAASGGSFIPGCRNHFDPVLGFNFRINLSRDSTMFRGTFVRLLNYIEETALTKS